MTNMRCIVRSYAAGVHEYTRTWFERHDGLTSGIEQPDWQLTIPFLFLFGDRTDTCQLRRNSRLIANIQLQKNCGESLNGGRI